MKKPLNPKWELLLSVLIFVIPCLVIALFHFYAMIVFGWEPGFTPFPSYWILKLCMAGIVAFSIIGVLLCLFLWIKKGKDVMFLGFIAFPLVFCSGVLVYLFCFSIKSFWKQTFAEVIRFISSL